LFLYCILDLDSELLKNENDIKDEVFSENDLTQTFDGGVVLQINKDQHLNNFLNRLILNFNTIQKMMFYVMAQYNWDQTEQCLINRMLETNCYVFPVSEQTILGETNIKYTLIPINKTLIIDPNQNYKSKDFDYKYHIVDF
jgi:hypothetical protein